MDQYGTRLAEKRSATGGKKSDLFITGIHTLGFDESERWKSNSDIRLLLLELYRWLSRLVRICRELVCRHPLVVGACK